MHLHGAARLIVDLAVRPSYPIQKCVKHDFSKVLVDLAGIAPASHGDGSLCKVHFTPCATTRRSPGRYYSGPKVLGFIVRVDSRVANRSIVPYVGP